MGVEAGLESRADGFLFGLCFWNGIALEGLAVKEGEKKNVSTSTAPLKLVETVKEVPTETEAKPLPQPQLDEAAAKKVAELTALLEASLNIPGGGSGAGESHKTDEDGTVSSSCPPEEVLSSIC